MKPKGTAGRGDRAPEPAANLQRQDAERWRKLVAIAREVFDDCDALAAEQGDPEGVPLFFEGAEGWATDPLRLAGGKGRLALERGDVEGIALALVQAGHAERHLEIVKRWVATIERVGKVRAERAAKTRAGPLDERDRTLLAALDEAPPAARKSRSASANWLLAEGHSTLTKRHLERRLQNLPSDTRK